MKKAIAVVVSDVHYNINTLEVADKAMRLAIAKANDLDVLLIVAGDLHDNKANLRGECVNRMIETFETCKHLPVVLIGNHDKINEKSVDHSLNFLKVIVFLQDGDAGEYVLGGISFIPYQSNPSTFIDILRVIPKDRIIIAHQGITNSNAGHYIQDKSAIRPEDVAGRRIISGHYHTRQTIKLPDGGQWDYIGNPYTLGFGEANDPEKGFQILYDDGSLEFVPSWLRKHVIVEMEYGKSYIPPIFHTLEDKIWVKVKGTREQLSTVTKASINKQLQSHSKLKQDLDFKLDLIPLDATTEAPKAKDQTQGEILDSLIDSLTNTSDEQKARVKQLWKYLK